MKTSEEDGDGLAIWGARKETRGVCRGGGGECEGEGGRSGRRRGREGLLMEGGAGIGEE